MPETPEELLTRIKRLSAQAADLKKFLQRTDLTEADRAGASWGEVDILSDQQHLLAELSLKLRGY